MQINSQENREILLSLEQKMNKSNWYIHKNEKDHIGYTKKYSECEVIELFIDSYYNINKIYVNVPIQNSRFKYRTSFNINAITEAIQYIEKHLQYNE